MTRQLEVDLAAWEAGEMTATEIDLRHPGEDAVGLIDLHERLDALTAEPTPDPAAGWARLSERLSEPTRGRPTAFAGLRRSLAAAIAAALLLGGTALAAPEAVREGFEKIRHGVGELVGIDVEPEEAPETTAGSPLSEDPPAGPEAVPSAGNGASEPGNGGPGHDAAGVGDFDDGEQAEGSGDSPEDESEESDDGAEESNDGAGESNDETDASNDGSGEPNDDALDQDLV